MDDGLRAPEIYEYNTDPECVPAGPCETKPVDYDKAVDAFTGAVLEKERAQLARTMLYDWMEKTDQRLFELGSQLAEVGRNVVFVMDQLAEVNMRVNRLEDRLDNSPVIAREVCNLLKELGMNAKPKRGE